MRPSFLWVLLPGLIAIAAWFHWLGQPDYPLDDAYIVQYIVERLLHGGVSRFAEAAPFDGATSPVHVLLITLLAIWLPVDWAQLLLAASSFLLYVYGVFCLARREHISVAESAIVAALSALSGLSLYHFMNGLETGLAMAAIVWALLAFRDPLPEKFWHGLLLGILPFIRPELAALSLCFLVRAFWSSVLDRKGISACIAVVAWPLFAGLLFASVLILAGGSPLPGTVSAKLYFFAEGCLPLDSKMEMVGFIAADFLLGLGVACVGFVGLYYSRYGRLGLAFIVAFFTAYMVQFPGALHHNGFRYLYLITPFMVLGWVGLIAASSGVVLTVARSAMAIAVMHACIGVSATMAKYEEDISMSRVERAGVSRWVDENVADDAIVMVHDAGYISLHGKHRLIDLVGLKTPSNIKVHRDFTWARCSRDPKAIDRIALQSAARFLVVLDEWDQAFKLTESLQLMSWEVRRVDGRRGSRTAYKVFQIAKPDDSQASGRISVRP